MTLNFRVTVLGSELLEELEGSWTAEDFAQLLDAMSYGETSELSPEELREMCVLSLQDLAPEEAGALLLTHRLGDAFNKSRIESLAHEMLDEAMWEHHAQMQLHERFFHVGGLLYQAFPDLVPAPDAVDLHVEVTAEGGPESERALAGPLHESFLVRLLAAGMPKSATLRRLFEDSLSGKPFPEAESIVWISRCEPVDARTVRLHVIGAGQWLAPLRDAEPYESAARPDPAPAR